MRASFGWAVLTCLPIVYGTCFAHIAGMPWKLASAPFSLVSLRRVAMAPLREALLIVRGDAAVQYQKVVEVLDLLRQLELSKVGLVTGKPGQG